MLGILEKAAGRLKDIQYGIGDTGNYEIVFGYQADPGLAAGTGKLDRIVSQDYYDRYASTAAISLIQEYHESGQIQSRVYTNNVTTAALDGIRYTYEDNSPRVKTEKREGSLAYAMDREYRYDELGQVKQVKNGEGGNQRCQEIKGVRNL